MDESFKSVVESQDQDDQNTYNASSRQELAVAS
jgi:hypothetical protein